MKTEHDVKVCKMCGKSFCGSWTKTVDSQFCSQKCSRGYSTYNKRKQISDSVSKKMRLNYQTNKEQKIKQYAQMPSKCVICGKVLPYENRNNKTCSVDCKSRYLSIKQKETKRRYVENGQGRGRSGWYKGFFCNSTYELVFVIYCLDHNLNIKRNTRYFTYQYNGEEHRYYPDFIVDGKFYEIKGYKTKIVEEKLKSVKEGITALYYEDLQKHMNYVDSVYGTSHSKNNNNYWSLYEEQKNYKYVYKCDFCGCEIKTMTKRYNKHTFCSLSCSTKFAHKNHAHSYKRRYTKPINDLELKWKKIKEEFPYLKKVEGHEGYCHDGENIYSYKRNRLVKLKVYGKNVKCTHLGKVFVIVSELINR